MLREDDRMFLSNLIPDQQNPVKRKPKMKTKTEKEAAWEIKKTEDEIRREELKLKRAIYEEEKEKINENILACQEYQELWRKEKEKEGNIQRAQRRFRKKYKKKKPEVVYELVKKELKDKDWLTKEELSFKYKVPEYQIEQAFMRLNREGLLSQAEHRYAHDNNRNPWDGGWFSGWLSDRYYVRRKI